MTTIILKPHKEESLLRFHPWVFSGAIARVILDAGHKGDAPEWMPGIKAMLPKKAS